MFEINWSGLVEPTHSLFEMFLRGTLVYLVLFLGFRFLPRRQLGGLSASDILVVVLIADAVQDAMSAGGYDSLLEGFVLAGTVIFWSWLVDWLDYRYPGLKVTAPSPTMVIRDGRLLRANMDRQHITEEEVLSQLREHGVDSPGRVQAAYMEGDGHFSVILRRGPAIDGAASQKGVGRG